MEGKGDCSIGRLGQYQHIMRCLWEEISDLADFDNVRNSFCHKKEKLSKFELQIYKIQISLNNNNLKFNFFKYLTSFQW